MSDSGSSLDRSSEPSGGAPSDMPVRDDGLSLLGAMTCGIVHEINNLMTITVGSIERLAREGVVADCHHTSLERLRWATLLVVVLTRLLLTGGIPRPAEPELCDLNEIVGRFACVVRIMAGERKKIELDLADTCLHVVLDIGRFRLALLNLVRNSADAMPDGGVIDISCRRHVDPRQPSRPAVAMAVSDNGTGMAPDILQRVTQPFFTTKSGDAGTGLGLTMVGHFAADMGGRMEIVSSDRRGTTVTLIFPIAG